MKKLCIFDLDGTLASTLESMAVAANRVLRELNLPEQPTESFKYFAGDGAKELCRRCLRAAGDMECAHYEEMYRKYREYFSETCMYKVVPYPGIPELLEKLKEAGIRITVLSNKPHAQAVDVVEKAILMRYRDKQTAFRESLLPSVPTVWQSFFRQRKRTAFISEIQLPIWRLEKRRKWKQ